MKNVEHKWTAQDIPSQAGRLALVTGATSGVGFYTAKELARKKATVIMPAREGSGLVSGPLFRRHVLNPSKIHTEIAATGTAGGQFFRLGGIWP
jgi:NAD(P)-dependent dehydrogenase (short-subunit alcohol dehydrogenase family)